MIKNKHILKTWWKHIDLSLQMSTAISPPPHHINHYHQTLPSYPHLKHTTSQVNSVAYGSSPNKMVLSTPMRNTRNEPWRGQYISLLPSPPISQAHYPNSSPPPPPFFQVSRKQMRTSHGSLDPCSPVCTSPFCILKEFLFWRWDGAIHFIYLLRNGAPRIDTVAKGKTDDRPLNVLLRVLRLFDGRAFRLIEALQVVFAILWVLGVYVHFLFILIYSYLFLFFSTKDVFICGKIKDMLLAVIDLQVLLFVAII